MEIYQITHHDGTKGKITQHQALKITKMMFDDIKTPRQKYDAMYQKNKHYLHRAKKNLKTMFELQQCPQTQEQLKKLMYEHLPNLTYKQADALQEMIEMIIGMYFMYLDDED